MILEVRASDFPGRSCIGYENIHVGVRFRNDPVELVPGDAPSARWELDLTTRDTPEGDVDFGGPYVFGKRGERFVYLRWGTVDGKGAFELFRAAKLHLNTVDQKMVREAIKPGRRLVGALGLTDGKGNPLCASVRPPVITWSVDS
jgi:hypothetical protein